MIYLMMELDYYVLRAWCLAVVTGEVDHFVPHLRLMPLLVA
jgi:hypothetical protein